jgi:hypothetical protein
MAGVVPLAREGWGRDQLWISRKALIACWRLVKEIAQLKARLKAYQQGLY